jgi:competence CoiA-like predicted nuclease
VLFALSISRAAIYHADRASAEGAPYACPECLSRVHVRNSPHQYTHWVHQAGSGTGCRMRRDAVSGPEILALRTADEIRTYGKSP